MDHVERAELGVEEVAGLGEDDDLLRLVGAIEDGLAHVDRNNTIAGAVEDEQRCPHLVDHIDRVVAIGHEGLHPHPGIVTLSRVRDRGVGRIEDDPLDRLGGRHLDGDAGAEALAIDDDLLRPHTLITQPAIGELRVGDVVRLGRMPGRAAVAPVGEHEHTVASAAIEGDPVTPAGEIAAVAVEVEQRRLAGSSLRMPGDEPLAIGCREHDLGDIQTDRGRDDTRRISRIEQASLASIERDTGHEVEAGEGKRHFPGERGGAVHAGTTAVSTAGRL